MKNKQIEINILLKMIEKCKFLLEKEIHKGEIKIIDRYFSIKELKQLLNDFYKQT